MSNTGQPSMDARVTYYVDEAGDGVLFGPRGRDRQTRQNFLAEHRLTSAATLEIIPSYPWEQPCLQVADYCLWALQRCYEKHEARFLNAIWTKVSLIHDVDDPRGAAGYGTYLSRKGLPPNPEQIKNRWI